MTTEPHETNLTGIDDLDAVAAADANRPYGEVTAEDLDTEELVQDGGGDAITAIPEDGAPVDEVLSRPETEADETIEDRLAQEEPDLAP